MKWIAAALLVSVLAATAASAQDGKVVRWLKAEGHRVMAPEPTAVELAPLVERLSGSRVIGVGEVTHGTHEDQAFKAALIKELVKARAVNVLVLEANRTPARDFDRYVRLGEGDPVALIKAPGFFKIWQGDEFAGLLLWLRAWNYAHPAQMIRIIGIDNQDGAADAAFALDYLAMRDPALAAKLRPAFGTLLTLAGTAPVKPFAWIQSSKPGELSAALVAAATLCNALNAKQVSWGADRGYAEARYAATVAWQNLNEFELEVGVVPFDKLPVEYLGRRDRFMAQNLTALMGSGERAAFWAHDNHVMAELPAEIADKGYSTVGIELKRQLRADYRAVGFTYSRALVLTERLSGDGRDLNNLPSEETLPLVNDRPQDVGSIFSRLPGDTWWIDLRPRPGNPVATRFLRAAMWRGWAGVAVDPDKFQPESDWDRPPVNGAGFDVLVWFRAMTPQHRWPVATSLAHAGASTH